MLLFSMGSFSDHWISAHNAYLSLSEQMFTCSPSPITNGIKWYKMRNTPALRTCGGSWSWNDHLEKERRCSHFSLGMRALWEHHFHKLISCNLQHQSQTFLANPCIQILKANKYEEKLTTLCSRRNRKMKQTIGKRLSRRKGDQRYIST